jgi:hypothetical protein
LVLVLAVSKAVVSSDGGVVVVVVDGRSGFPNVTRLPIAFHGVVVSASSASFRCIDAGLVAVAVTFQERHLFDRGQQ